MKLFNAISAAAVIGSGFLVSAVPANAQAYYGRTKPTFQNPSGRSYSRIAIRTTTALAQMATAPMVSIAIAHRQHAVDTDTKQPQRAAIF